MVKVTVQQQDGVQIVPGITQGTTITPTGTAMLLDAHYTHKQLQPDQRWLVTHGLGKHPAVSVVDSAGSLVVGDVRYLDLSTLEITFSAAFGGVAYCN